MLATLVASVGTAAGIGGLKVILSIAVSAGGVPLALGGGVFCNYFDTINIGFGRCTHLGGRDSRNCGMP